ncbi:MAG: hypothetical protein ACR2K6_01550 [Solirubrobacterales bacterium]
MLLHLLQAGSDAVERECGATADAHGAAVLASSGRYPDAFGEDHLTELREDWPA